jgi:hypothetical protein
MATSKYIPLKQVVSYWLDENDKSSGDFDKAWIIAYRALMELGFNISFEPKTVRLPVNGNMTATLPSDYIQWSKIGIINASGEVSTLKINTALTKFRDNNPNRISAITPDIPDSNFAGLILSPYFLNYYFGNYYSPLFGLGAGLVQYGECIVDEQNGIIVLSPTYALPDVLLEYISNPQMDGDYQIEVVAQEAIIAFLNWKFKTGSQQDWYARLIEARRRIKPITLQEIQQGIRENQKYSLKN